MRIYTNTMLAINENTTLHSVGLHQCNYDDDGTEIPLAYALSFSFYDCEYDVWVSESDLKNDRRSVTMHGDTRLFDSFENFCQDDLWQTIKVKCWDYRNSLYACA
jgi:hypothetical protein